jgi:rubrerythrin
MDTREETKTTIQARLKILNKSLVSEENSVQYYQTLLDNTPSDSEEKIGEWRMYEELQTEEKKHVEVIRGMITHWENQLKAMD